jgi:hypothetical protein
MNHNHISDRFTDRSEQSAPEPTDRESRATADVDVLVATELRRRFRVVLLALGIAAVGAALVVLLYLLVVDDANQIRAVLLAGAVVALAGFAAAAWGSNRIPGQLKDLFAGDPAQRRRVRKAVLSRSGSRPSIDGHPGPPRRSGDDLDVAARYARVLVVYLPLRITWMALFMVFVTLQQLALAAAGRGDTSSAAFMVLATVVAVAALVFVIVMLVQFGRARRFARQHAVVER